MSKPQDMMVIPINFAEAIIEPFFNGGTSDQHENRNTFVLDHYTCEWQNGAIGRMEQMWDGVYGFLQGGTTDETCLTMRRDCALDVSGYDSFIVFAGIPDWVRLSIDLTVDGNKQRVIDGVAGADQAIEVEGTYQGAWLSEIEVTLDLKEAPASTTFHLKWFGLANSANCERMFSQPNRFTQDWPGFLDGRSDEDRAGLPEPQIGIYFGPEELTRIRELVTDEPFRTVFEGIAKQAREDLKIVPEAYIGETNPGGTDRYIRVRRREMKDLSGPAVRLAFVGLVQNDREMSCLAARMALSLTFCQTWDESTIGHLPGSIWHHRSFSQERAIKAASLVLDWAGHFLTTEAKRVIRDAIIMKGLPRLENDFRTIEYIRKMNQGIVFNAARIIGLLALLPVYPRYRSVLEEAESDLHEMIGNYVHADGGTLEGCGYWNYTFSNALPQCYLLARYHGKTLQQYATDTIRKTGDYPLAMLSIEGDGTTCLPINDGHSGPVSPLLAAAFAQITGSPDWMTYYACSLTPERVQPQFEHLVLHPAGFDTAAQGTSLGRPRFVVLSDTGQVDSVRKNDEGTLVHLHFLSGPVEAGHYHEDKGSFILEVGDEAMFIDRGICNYGHPMTVMLKMPWLHNILTPDNPGEFPIAQPNDVPGGALLTAEERGMAVWMSADNTEAWQPGVFNRCIRRIVSPAPNLFLIDDDIELTKQRSMTLNLHTRKHSTLHGTVASIAGENHTVRVTPINWTPTDATSGIDGIDQHLDEVTSIRLKTAEGSSHRLVTALEVLPVGGEPMANYEAADSVIRGEYGGCRFTLDVTENGRATFSSERGDDSVQVSL